MRCYYNIYMDKLPCLELFLPYLWLFWLTTEAYRKLFNEFMYVCAQSFSRVWFFVTPWTVPHQVSLPMDFPGKDTKVGFISCFRGSSQPWDQTRGSCVSCVGRRLFTTEPVYSAKLTKNKNLDRLVITK